MKILFRILVVSFLAFTASCKDRDDISIDTLRDKVSKDPLYIAYNEALDNQVELFATGKVTFKGVDVKYIDKYKSLAETEEQLIQVYQKGGMKNAKEYLVASANVRTTYAKIVNKYYRLANMTIAERQRFMESIKIPVKHLDPLATFKERKKNLSNN